MDELRIWEKGRREFMAKLDREYPDLRK
jgi:hypothetical protein